MGGARAGEVASRLAAESFDTVQRGTESPEAYLRAIAKTANARIHRAGPGRQSRSGMGTTLTAALVEGDEVGIRPRRRQPRLPLAGRRAEAAHLDHSLVEELRRQGRLTDEQAEDHPQRSIITRALGPEREVEVDTHDLPRAAGRRLPAVLRRPDDDGPGGSDRRDARGTRATLDEAASALIAEANEAGGRDNITVVAFRLDDAEAPVRADDQHTLVGPAAEEAGLTAGVAAAAAGAARRGANRRPPREAPLPPPRPRRSWPRRTAKVLAVVLDHRRRSRRRLSGACGRSTSSGRTPAAAWPCYRGLPYDLPLGIKLYSEVYAAPVRSARSRESPHSATDHTLRFHDDAASLLKTSGRGGAAPAQQAAANKARAAASSAGGGQAGAARTTGGGAAAEWRRRAPVGGARR